MENLTNFRFNVIGNPDDPKGNPQPYFRQTQGSKHSPGAKRYQRWQWHVADALINQVEAVTGQDSLIRRNIAMSMIKNYRPLNIAPGHDVCVEAEIYVKDNKHADADNIFKGILDSIFVNDKQVVEGHFKLFHSKEIAPQVIVTIKIKPNEKL